MPVLIYCTQNKNTPPDEHVHVFGVLPRQSYYSFVLFLVSVQQHNNKVNSRKSVLRLKSCGLISLYYSLHLVALSLRGAP